MEREERKASSAEDIMRDLEKSDALASPLSGAATAYRSHRTGIVIHAV